MSPNFFRRIILETASLKTFIGYIKYKITLTFYTNYDSLWVANMTNITNVTKMKSICELHGVLVFAGEKRGNVSVLG